MQGSCGLYVVDNGLLSKEEHHIIRLRDANSIQVSWFMQKWENNPIL